MSGPNRCASADKPAASSSAALSVLLSTFLGSVPDAARYEFRAGELTREPVRAERHVLKQKTIFIRGFGCQAHLLRALRPADPHEEVPRRKLTVAQLPQCEALVELGALAAGVSLRVAEPENSITSS